MVNTNNIVACEYVVSNGAAFYVEDPSTNKRLDGEFHIAGIDLINNALNAATAAFKVYKFVTGKKKAEFLRAIAAEINAASVEVIERASIESGLAVARITGELGRTTGQLNLFAAMVEEGSWVDAVIDTAKPDRTPLAKPDIRRMLTPIGPVVVFGASNFPLAFSVAGGDTASALASGCPVIVKVHPAHPGTSALIGSAIIKAVEATQMPKGVFSMLYDNGYEAGAALVKHEQTKAVAFTGSFKGGMALLKLGRERNTPIPVFAEMGSINPVVLLPGIVEAQPEQLAEKLAASITLGAGQFCTNPGLIIAVKSPGLDRFTAVLGEKIENTASATMLTSGIYKNYQNLSGKIISESETSLIAQSKLIVTEKRNQSSAAVARVSAKAFIINKNYREEIFGPWSLLVVADDIEELKKVIASLEGQLTATVMAEKSELSGYGAILDALAEISGRVILNGVPTGVEVCAAMQHGGPFPATSDSRFTSVGTGAIYRFVRPVAWQDWADELLPAELQSSNPLNIWRQVDNNRTKN